jgi:hypothetical protein
VRAAACLTVYTTDTIRRTVDKGWTNLRASGTIVALDKPWTVQEAHR